MRSIVPVGPGCVQATSKAAESGLVGARAKEILFAARFMPGRVGGQPHQGHLLERFVSALSHAAVT